MRNSIYVLAKHGEKQELVFGNFHGMERGDMFKRNPGAARTSPTEWQIVRTYTQSETAFIDSLVMVMGEGGFSRFAALFRVN